MEKQQLIAKFNPSNAANLTAQDLEQLRALTDEDIQTLAEAYPNQPTRRSYLRLYNTSLAENKQLYPLSTWQNLRNARKFSNMKNLVPFDFVTSPASISKQKAVAGNSKAAPATKKVVVDLSAKEAAAELTAKVGGKTGAPGASVEKKGTTATKMTVAKPAKPAAGAKVNAKPAEKPAPDAAVDNTEKPASEQFPEVK